MLLVVKAKARLGSTCDVCDVKLFVQLFADLLFTADHVQVTF